MLNAPLLRAGAYLFVSLLGMMLGSLFPKPYAELTHFLFVLALLLLEGLVYSKKSVHPFSLLPQKGSAPTLLLFPVFFALTLGVNLLSSHVTIAFGGALPTVSPSFSLFVGAVILAPVTEELLFRGLLLHLFSPYGKRTAILLSALFFALAHGTFFQMPYALIAGVILAYVSVVGGSVLYPLFFHIIYNLFAFFDGVIPPFWLLGIAAGCALLSLLVLWTVRPAWRLDEGEKPNIRQGWLLLLYAGEMLYIAFSRL